MVYGTGRRAILTLEKSEGAIFDGDGGVGALAAESAAELRPRPNSAPFQAGRVFPSAMA